METQLLDTKVGQAMVADALKRGVSPAFTDRYFHSYLHDDPWPLYVRYESGKTTFVPRDRFYFCDPEGPSASLWIVPGSIRA